MTPAEKRFAEYICATSARARSRRFLYAEKDLAIALGLAAIAGASAWWGYGLAPRTPDAVHWSAMAFYPAVVISGYFAGRRGAWITALLCLLLEAIKLPPEWSVEIDGQFMPWFIQTAASLCLVAWFSTRRLEPHPPDQSIAERERVRIAQRPMSVFMPFRENVVK